MLLQVVVEKLLYSLRKTYSDSSHINDSSNNASKVDFGHCQILSFVCFVPIGSVSSPPGSEFGFSLFHIISIANSAFCSIYTVVSTG